MLKSGRDYVAVFANASLYVSFCRCCSVKEICVALEVLKSDVVFLYIQDNHKLSGTDLKKVYDSHDTIPVPYNGENSADQALFWETAASSDTEVFVSWHEPIQNLTVRGSKHDLLSFCGSIWGCSQLISTFFAFFFCIYSTVIVLKTRGNRVESSYIISHKCRLNIFGGMLFCKQYFYVIVFIKP